LYECAFTSQDLTHSPINKEDPSNVTREKSQLFIGIGLAMMIYGTVAALNETAGRPTGQWSIVLGPLYDSFGSIGVGGGFFVPGMVFLILGLIGKRDKS
jgi:hypothetical protein